jgi:hypothetical protein
VRMTALLPTLQRVASRKATRPCTLTNQREPAAHDTFSSNGPGFHSLPPTPPPYHGITYTPTCHRTQPPTTTAKSKKHDPPLKELALWMLGATPASALPAASPWRPEPGLPAPRGDTGTRWCRGLELHAALPLSLPSLLLACTSTTAPTTQTGGGTTD